MYSRLFWAVAMQFISIAAALAAPVSARIINGSPTTIENRPWIASIHLNGYEPWGAKHGHFCAGTLIHSEWVLTAAHCVQGVTNSPGMLAVTLGRTKLSAAGIGVTIPVDLFLIHPRYNKGTNTFDAALLKLRSPVSYTPLKLSYELDTVTGGALAVAVGWGVLATGQGLSDTLQEVSMPLQPDATCTQAYGSAYFPESQLCAGRLASSPAANDGLDACSGDSGGPLVTIDGAGSLHQAGITSWGWGACGNSRYYGVYSRVPAFSEWIAVNVPLAPQFSGVPTVTGTASAGAKLTCEPGTISGIISTTEFLWEDSTGRNLNSVSSASYLLQKADIGRVVRCTVTATGGGRVVRASSSWIGPVKSEAARAKKSPSVLPIIKRVLLSCRAKKCSFWVGVTRPPASTHKLIGANVQGSWKGKTCTIRNGKRSCVDQASILSVGSSAEDPTNRYFTFRFSVPATGTAVLRVKAADDAGNVSIEKVYRLRVS